MKLEPPRNPNYCATVVRVHKVLDLSGLDNLVGFPVFGMQALVGRDSVGMLGVVFPAEAQLSPEFTSMNNLYRHANLNADPGQTGYLEDSRRVQAIKLRGHRSDALFVPLSSLAYCFPGGPGGWVDLTEGDEFDTLNGHEICRKYVVGPRGPQGHGRGAVRRFPESGRVDKRRFPEQFAIGNYFKVEQNCDSSQQVVVTQKLHGTSVRVGWILVDRHLSIREQVARRLGVSVQLQDYAFVTGSHHVVKSVVWHHQGKPRVPVWITTIKRVGYGAFFVSVATVGSRCLGIVSRVLGVRSSTSLAKHFYDEDLWSREGHKLDGLVPENYVVYGELIGWVSSGRPIQAHYTYDCEVGTCKLYVYRVAVINSRGLSVDLSWDAVKQFCQERGLNHVVELWRGPRKLAPVTNWLDTKFTDYQFMRDAGAVPLSKDSPCDEGICIRAEGLVPMIHKAKSPLFLGHETKMLDTGQTGDPEEEYTFNV